VNSKNDLTILLTLKDRAAYTIRWMNYANAIAFPFKVLIADGGSDESMPAMFSDKTRFPKVDFEYVRYPYDKSYSDYYTKIADALRRVTTPFVAMADNDDFFVVDTMNEAIRFLAVNSDYVSCGGESAHFWIEPSLGNETESRLYSKHIDWKCTHHGRSIAGDSAIERIRSQSLRLSDIFYYDVKRTEEARRQFELVRDLNLNDLFLVEMLILFLTAIAGKTKRLEHMYLARQYNSPNSSGAVHSEKYGDWFGRMLLDSWSSDFAKFVNSVSGCLAAAEGISVDEARNYVISLYRMHVAPSLLSSILDEPSVTMSMPIVASIVRRLVSLPEHSIPKKLMRKLYRGVRWISLDAVYGEKVFGVPVTNSRKDFQPIVEFLARPR
jgi:glycosyltransferase domain-containing protein